MDVTTEKPLYPKHNIEFYQELLAVDYPQAELQIWYLRTGKLLLIKIRILSLLGIILKRLANINPTK